MDSKTQLIRSSGPLSTPIVTEYFSGGGYHDEPSFDSHREGTIRYWSIVRRHARTLIVVFSICFLLAGLATFLMPPAYKAQTLVEVLAVNSDFLNSKDVDPNASTTTMDTYLETQTKLLTSDAVAERAIAALQPRASSYTQAHQGGWAHLKQWLGFPATPESTQADIASAVSKVKVKADGASSLLRITTTGATPTLAADAVNAIADQHIAALQEARWKTASDTADFLSKQLEAQKRKLEASDQELQDYAKKTGLIYTSDSDRDSVAAEKLRELQADVDKAESDRADKQAQLELVKASPADALPKVLDNESLREDKSRLTDLRRQLADLSETLTPNHYKVKEVQAQIAALEKQSAQERTTILARIENDFHAAQRREQIQKQAYDRQLAVLSDQSGKAVRYKMLLREVDANRELYQSTLSKIHEASVLSALRASNVRIVDRAKPPRRPSQPSLPVNLAIAFLAGSMISVLFVLLRERNNQSIRVPGESTRLLQVPELAIIPSARRDIRTQIVSNTAGRRDINGQLLPLKAHTPNSSELITNWQNNGSMVAESFRSAVTSILLWGRDRALNHKVLVVTSAHPAAGKTTSVLNMGLALAESGRKVLLIDGDLRLPRLGQIFGMQDAAGLGEALAAEMSPANIKELIRETGIRGLSVLPSGLQQPNVTQILHSTTLQTLIDYLKPDYDFILVDSPPALPLADARLLARHADGVILIVRAGETSIEQSKAVRKSFRQDGTPVFGSILNDWDARDDTTGYLKSYSKYIRAAGD